MFESLVPSKYFEIANEKLQSASGSQLQIRYKLTNAHVCNQGMCMKTTFVLVKNLTTPVILGTPFLNLLYPISKIDHQGITTSILGQDIIFEFSNPVDTNNITLIKKKKVLRKLIN